MAYYIHTYDAAHHESMTGLNQGRDGNGSLVLVYGVAAVILGLGVIAYNILPRATLNKIQTGGRSAFVSRDWSWRTAGPSVEEKI